MQEHSNCERTPGKNLGHPSGTSSEKSLAKKNSDLRDGSDSRAASANRREELKGRSSVKKTSESRNGVHLSAGHGEQLCSKHSAKKSSESRKKANISADSALHSEKLRRSSSTKKTRESRSGTQHSEKLKRSSSTKKAPESRSGTQHTEKLRRSSSTKKTPESRSGTHLSGGRAEQLHRELLAKKTPESPKEVNLKAVSAEHSEKRERLAGKTYKSRSGAPLSTRPPDPSGKPRVEGAAEKNSAPRIGAYPSTGPAGVVENPQNGVLTKITSESYSKVRSSKTPTNKKDFTSENSTGNGGKSSSHPPQKGGVRRCGRPRRNRMLHDADKGARNLRRDAAIVMENPQNGVLTKITSESYSKVRSSKTPTNKKDFTSENSTGNGGKSSSHPPQKGGVRRCGRPRRNRMLHDADKGARNLRRDAAIAARERLIAVKRVPRRPPSGGDGARRPFLWSARIERKKSNISQLRPQDRVSGRVALSAVILMIISGIALGCSRTLSSCFTRSRGLKFLRPVHGSPSQTVETVWCLRGGERSSVPSMPERVNPSTPGRIAPTPARSKGDLEAQILAIPPPSPPPPDWPSDAFDISPRFPYDMS